VNAFAFFMLNFSEFPKFYGHFRAFPYTEFIKEIKGDTGGVPDGAGPKSPVASGSMGALPLLTGPVAGVIITPGSAGGR
jgi:hypothetical protein